MFLRSVPSLTKILGLASAAFLLAGCAAKAPQGYGVIAAQNTAAMAQAQMQAAEQATQLESDKTYLDLIAQMQQAGQWYASLAHTEAFVRQHGATPDVQLLRADALRNTQQHEAAQQVYQSLINTPVAAARAHRGMGLLAASQGQYGTAIESLEAARKINPIDADVLSGQLEAARIPAVQAAQLAPDNVRVQMNLALFWMSSGEQAMGGQLLEKLQQPRGKAGKVLINAEGIQHLNQQVQIVKTAVSAKASGAVSPVRPAKGQVINLGQVSELPPPPLIAEEALALSHVKETP
jgi:Flp pilus assembly protein TadD